jgi:hypothetical protein
MMGLMDLTTMTMMMMVFDHDIDRPIKVHGYGVVSVVLGIS